MTGEPDLNHPWILCQYIEAAGDGEHPEQAQVLLDHAHRLGEAGIKLPGELVAYLDQAANRFLAGKPLDKALNLRKPNHRPNKSAERKFGIAATVRELMVQGNTLDEATEIASNKYYRAPSTLRDIYSRWKWLLEPEKWPDLIRRASS